MRAHASLTWLTGILLLASLAAATGCGQGVRFSVDLIDNDRGVRQTTVASDDGASSWSDAVAMIEVNGMIQNARTAKLLGSGPNPVDQLVQQLARAKSDSKVKAVILRVNSRGGTVTASEMMYEELKRFREESGKPIVVSMADYAASGGYYIACAGDVLMAAPSTITGSIGVIMQTWDVSEGLDRLGVTAEAITSGPNKAMASPLSPMSTEHRELLQGIVNEFYGAFRGVVESSRPGIDAGVIDSVTDGRVVTGTQAAELGLIDRTGTIHDAFAVAKELAGIERGRLVKYHGAGTWVGSPYAEAPAPQAESDTSTTQFNMINLNLGQGLFEGGVEFMYVWDPRVHWRDS